MRKVLKEDYFPQNYGRGHKKVFFNIEFIKNLGSSKSFRDNKNDCKNNFLL